MSYTERRSLIGLILTLLITPLFYVFYIKTNVSADLNDSIDFVGWAWAFIWFFGILIVTRIILTIVQVIVESIVYGIKNHQKDNEFVEKELKNRFIEDERYKIIDLRVTKHMGTILTIGFMLGMILIVGGMSPSILFYLMYVAFAVSGMTADLLAIFYERRGL